MKSTNEVEVRDVSWDETRRRAQSQRTKSLKPWLVSTGPKTLAGKKRSSRNALKHGHRSARTIRFKRILRQAKKYLAFVKSLNRIERERRRIALGLIKPPPISVIPATQPNPFCLPRGGGDLPWLPLRMLETPNTINFDIIF